MYNNWITLLSITQLVYNNKESEIIKYLLFFSDYRKKANLFLKS